MRRRAVILLIGAILLPAQWVIYLPVVMARPHFGLVAQMEGRMSPQMQYVRPGGFVQVNIDWSLAEPDPGVYVWPDKLDVDYDRLIIGIRATPEWAREWPEERMSRPAESAWPAFARFTVAVIDRYNPVAVALGNEPEVCPEKQPDDWWYMTGWCDDAKDYGLFLRDTYRRVKAARPGVLLIGGELLASDLTWWARAESETDEAQYDVLSYHAYAHDGAGEEWLWLTRLEQLRVISPEALIYLSETSLLWEANEGCGDDFRQRQAAYYRDVRDNYFSQGLVGMGLYTIANNGWLCSDAVNGGVRWPMWYEYVEGEQ